MLTVRMAAVTCLLAGLTACGGSPPSPAPAPVLPRDVPEGTYIGTSTRFQADRKTCPHPGLVTVVVWDNKFQYKWMRDVYVDAVLAQDGSIRGDGPGISLQGKRTGKRIEGDVTNGDCGFHFTLNRKD
jgi:hypothetical protein